ncbi:MAG: hypothetical protein ABWY00_02830 [Dongiaceae bacterium]
MTDPASDDPKFLIQQAFAMGDEFPGPAEDLLLSWMLSLDMAVDARSAATRLLTLYVADPTGLTNPHVVKLAELLRQTAAAEAGRGGRGRIAARRAAARSQGR